MPRLFSHHVLRSGTPLTLDEEAARHVQVLRLQPGQALTLFDGQGGEFAATVTHMGRREVGVQVGEKTALEREATRALHLAVCLMANERMDWLVEKATELGAVSLQPLISQRCVLRLSGERADKRLARWQATVIAASEQCGRNRLMQLHPVLELDQWLLSTAGQSGARALLSLAAGAQSPTAFARSCPVAAPMTVLSGPEGGLSEAEQAHALTKGFSPLTLGPRVLRAETAVIAVTAQLAESPVSA